MKKSILGMMSGLMLLSCTESKPKTEYTITGKIPGVKDSTEVILYNAEGRKHKEIAKAVIENGTFTLTGEMNNPTECILNIAKGVKTEKGYDIYATVNLMLENDDYKISTQHIDSLPVYYGKEEPYQVKAKNIIIKGGKAQKEYAEYCSWMADAETEYWYKDGIYMDYFFSGSGERDMRKLERMKEESLDSEVAKDKRAFEFMKTRPSYAISVNLAIQQSAKKYNLTESDFDFILKEVAKPTDTLKFNIIKQNVDTNRKFARGMKFDEFACELPDKEQMIMAVPMSENKYTIVDFWASWCGPCKSAIPHVNEIYQEYKENLDVLSVSLDGKLKDWYKALEEEQMSWPQAILTAESYNEVTAKYGIQSIPCIMLINPQGEIEVVTYSPYLIKKRLAEVLGH